MMQACSRTIFGLLQHFAEVLKFHQYLTTCFSFVWKCKCQTEGVVVGAANGAAEQGNVRAAKLSNTMAIFCCVLGMLTTLVFFLLYRVD